MPEIHIEHFWDLITFVYVAVLIVAVYGFVLFAWWWRKVGKATDVYAYVTGLFFGIAWSAWIGIYSRYLHSNYDHTIYDGFVTSYKWAAGPVMILGILGLICWRMTRRVWRTYKHKKGFAEERRHKDKKE